MIDFIDCYAKLHTYPSIHLSRFPYNTVISNIEISCYKSLDTMRFSIGDTGTNRLNNERITSRDCDSNRYPFDRVQPVVDSHLYAIGELLCTGTYLGERNTRVSNEKCRKREDFIHIRETIVSFTCCCWLLFTVQVMRDVMSRSFESARPQAVGSWRIAMLSVMPPVRSDKPSNSVPYLSAS